MASLRQRIVEFLKQLVRSLDVPLIYRMWEAYQRHKKNVSANLRVDQSRQSSHELANRVEAENTALQLECKQLLQEKEALRAQLIESQSTWTSFAKDILAISQKLYRAIQRLPSKESIPRELLATSQEQIGKYEAFLKSNQSFFSREQPEPAESVPEPGPQTVRSSAESVHSAMLTEGKQQTELRPELERTQQLDLSPLDYSKITSFLATSADDLRVCALLQALRWRAMRNSHRTHRRQVVLDYIKGDLLGLNCGGEVMGRLLKHTNRKYVLWNIISL